MRPKRVMTEVLTLATMMIGVVASAAPAGAGDRTWSCSAGGMTGYARAHWHAVSASSVAIGWQYRIVPANNRDHANVWFWDFSIDRYFSTGDSGRQDGRWHPLGPTYRRPKHGANPDGLRWTFIFDKRGNDPRCDLRITHYFA